MKPNNEIFASIITIIVRWRHILMCTVPSMSYILYFSYYFCTKLVHIMGIIVETKLLQNGWESNTGRYISLKHLMNQTNHCYRLLGTNKRMIQTKQVERIQNEKWNVNTVNRFFFFYYYFFLLFTFTRLPFVIRLMCTRTMYVRICALFLLFSFKDSLCHFLSIWSILLLSLSVSFFSLFNDSRFATMAIVNVSVWLWLQLLLLLLKQKKKKKFLYCWNTSCGNLNQLMIGINSMIHQLFIQSKIVYFLYCYKVISKIKHIVGPFFYFDQKFK